MRGGLRGGRHHAYRNVVHGWWFYRGQCSCGWLTRRRWNPRNAEADLFEHQRGGKMTDP